MRKDDEGESVAEGGGLGGGGGRFRTVENFNVEVSHVRVSLVAESACIHNLRTHVSK